MVQHIRRTQFITTYGPGSILESPHGPRIILRPDIGLFRHSGLSPKDFEIPNLRISRGYLKNAHVFRLPSNEELGRGPHSVIYLTKPFPEWMLCKDHNILYRKRCPKCQEEGKFARRREEAIRFVLACPNGHLDDVDWDYVVHSRGDKVSGCRWSDWYYWHTSGSRLKDIEIECPRCGMRVNLGRAYKTEWPCTGRRPELEQPGGQQYERERCERKAIIIQKQAANLYIPEIITLFTIPPWDTPLHRMLSMIYDVIIAVSPRNKSQLKDALSNLLQAGRIDRATYEDILSYEWSEIERTIEDLRQEIPQEPAELFLQEFHALLRASEEGHPPATDPKGEKVYFRIDVNDVIEVKPRHGHGARFRVAPVSPLHTVMVLKGYRRLDPDPTNSRLREVCFKDDSGEVWYPGTELFGEGVFITRVDNGGYVSLSGDAAEKWMRAYNEHDPEKYPVPLFRDEKARDELHPLFVWWHTFSHLLMRSLSIDSGYASASIRERVYLEVTEGRARGGVILYTVQPGADGTLGGLVSLVSPSKFEKVIDRVCSLAETCSNDPLCREHRFAYGDVCGSACYGCLFVSETSCEYRNLWLDRHVFLDNPP